MENVEQRVMKIVAEMKHAALTDKAAIENSITEYNQ